MVAGDSESRASGAKRAETRFVVGDEIAVAVRRGRPVLALETAVVTHGLPRPLNLAAARACEEIVRRAGVVPATIAVLDGRVRVGLSDDELARLATDDQVRKCSLRDLAVVVAAGGSGGTTVAASVWAARRAGIAVFATGGIGGVHLGDAHDISTDLALLSRTPLVVVCSGAKSLLDLPATLQVLEAYGVPVIGWATDDLPAFYVAHSGLPITERVDEARAVADIARARDALGLSPATLVAVPVPADAALSSNEIDAAVATAVDEAERDGVVGARLTPFVLRRMAELTRGRTLAANEALLLNNAFVGANIAAAVAGREGRAPDERSHDEPAPDERSHDEPAPDEPARDGSAPDEPARDGRSLDDAPRAASEDA